MRRDGDGAPRYRDGDSLLRITLMAAMDAEARRQCAAISGVFALGLAVMWLAGALRMAGWW